MQTRSSFLNQPGNDMTKPSYNLNQIAETNTACLACSLSYDGHRHTCNYTPLCNCRDPERGPEQCEHHAMLHQQHYTLRQVTPPRARKTHPPSWTRHGMNPAQAARRKDLCAPMDVFPHHGWIRPNTQRRKCTLTSGVSVHKWCDNAPTHTDAGAARQRPNGDPTETHQFHARARRCLLCHALFTVKHCPLRPAVAYLRDSGMLTNILLSTRKRVHHPTRESSHEGLLHYGKAWTITGVNQDHLNDPDTRSAVPDLPQKPIWRNSEHYMQVQLENILYGDPTEKNLCKETPDDPYNDIRSASAPVPQRHEMPFWRTTSRSGSKATGSTTTPRRPPGGLAGGAGYHRKYDNPPFCNEVPLCADLPTRSLSALSRADLKTPVAPPAVTPHTSLADEYYRTTLLPELLREFADLPVLENELANLQLPEARNPLDDDPEHSNSMRQLTEMTAAQLIMSKLRPGTTHAEAAPAQNIDLTTPEQPASAPAQYGDLTTPSLNPTSHAQHVDPTSPSPAAPDPVETFTGDKPYHRSSTTGGATNAATHDCRQNDRDAISNTATGTTQPTTPAQSPANGPQHDARECREAEPTNAEACSHVRFTDDLLELTKIGHVLTKFKARAREQAASHNIYRQLHYAGTDEPHSDA